MGYAVGKCGARSAESGGVSFNPHPGPLPVRWERVCWRGVTWLLGASRWDRDGAIRHRCDMTRGPGAQEPLCVQQRITHVRVYDPLRQCHHANTPGAPTPRTLGAGAARATDVGGTQAVDGAARPTPTRVEISAAASDRTLRGRFLLSRTASDGGDRWAGA